MTPDFRPYLTQAIAEMPDQWQANTYLSCFTVLTRALQLAPDFAYIGKVDAESGFAPAGFVPFDVEVMRPDGQREMAHILRLSHDAVWHPATARQIKVIVNSAANSDERPEIHGPARIGGDIIDPVNYRYRNPPIPWERINGPRSTPGPSPVPPPPVGVSFPPQSECFDFGVALNLKYKTDRHAPFIGRDNEGADLFVNLKGMAVWLQEYLHHRVDGKSHAEAQVLVFATIDRIPL